MSDYALALHGGAGATRTLDYGREVAEMRRLLQLGLQRLGRGMAALDVACEIVAQLEDCGLFVAGRGASPNASGDYELDAAVADGVAGRSGAVAAIRHFRNPIQVARAVMEQTPHVMLAAEGAEVFADRIGAERHPAAGWFTHAAQGESNHPPAMATGTVGCVALDRERKLAAATSTAGVFGKMPGRIGDTPLLGAGFWADANCAVSCTGQGEYFVRSACAARVGLAVEAGASLARAAADALGAVARAGGEGGLIALDRLGNVAMPFNAEGMKRGYALADGTLYCAVFD